jgi:hypothetical protein
MTYEPDAMNDGLQRRAWLELPDARGPIWISALPKEPEEVRLPACAITTNVQIEVSNGHRLPFPAVRAANGTNLRAVSVACRCRNGVHLKCGVYEVWSLRLCCVDAILYCARGALKYFGEAYNV